MSGLMLVGMNIHRLIKRKQKKQKRVETDFLS